jgi:hypothetical protein
MATDQIVIDVNQIPGLGDLAEAVRRDRKSRILKRGGETLAYLEPAAPELDRQPVRGSTKKASRRGKRFTMADPLWDIVGMATSGGPGDVSDNKDKYLAEAYTAKGE